MPLQLYMAETHHSLASLHENVNRELRKSSRCIVVVNEGFDVGGVGERHDGFGHVRRALADGTGAILALPPAPRDKVLPILDSHAKLVR